MAQLLCLAVWLVVTGWIGQKAHVDLSELKALQRDGTVARAWMCYSYDRFGKQVTYCVGDQYLAGSHTFESGGQFSLSQHALVFEEPVTITYLTAHPETVRVGLVGAAQINKALLIWVAAIAAGGTSMALLLTCCLWGFALQHTLLRRGIAQEAMVTAKGYTNMLGRTVYAVFYTFMVGEEQYIHGTRIPKSLFPRFEQGMKITILHLPENPQSSLPAAAITAARL